MSAEQSEFSNQPKKILYLISQKLISDDFDEEYSTDTYDSNHTILSDISRMFSIDVVDDEDVQFFTKFIEINKQLISEISETKDRSLIDKLVIPIAKTYEMLYSTRGTCTYFLNKKLTLTMKTGLEEVF
jgi:predicted nucleotidyltransferase